MRDTFYRKRRPLVVEAVPSQQVQTFMEFLMKDEPVSKEIVQAVTPVYAAKGGIGFDEYDAAHQSDSGHTELQKLQDERSAVLDILDKLIPPGQWDYAYGDLQALAQAVSHRYRALKRLFESLLLYCAFLLFLCYYFANGFSLY